jgi:hypothetical protein
VQGFDLPLRLPQLRGQPRVRIGRWLRLSSEQQRLVSSGYSYTDEIDNPACALQAGLVIRIGLYR